MIEYRGPNQKPSMKQQDYSFLLRNFLKHYSLYLFSFLVLVSFIILLSSTSVSKADVTLDLKCKKGAGVILDQPYTFKFLELSSGKMKASFVNEDKTNFNVIGDDRALMWLVANFGSKLIFKFFLVQRVGSIIVIQTYCQTFFLDSQKCILHKIFDFWLQKIQSAKTTYI